MSEPVIVKPGPVSVILVTYHDRGDHGADVRLALNVQEGETIEELAIRNLKKPTDWIEIRPILPEGA